MFRRMARTAAVVWLLVLALASTAEARVGAPVAWQRKAIKQAEKTWHPACGGLSIVFEVPPPAASADDWAGWAFVNECLIHLNAARDWVGYPDFCQVVLHEAGHVTGRGHAEHGIMRPSFLIARTEIATHGHVVTQWDGVDRRCLPR